MKRSYSRQNNSILAQDQTRRGLKFQKMIMKTKRSLKILGKEKEYHIKNNLRK